MKHNLPSFFAGIACALLVSVLSVSALAATGTISITVDPTVKIQVNGTTFQPKDAKGKAVPVFIYNGTTYAPLRGLAEAYGLEVGYDAATGTATVGKQGSTAPAKKSDYSDWTAEEEKAYQEFKGMWEIKFAEKGSYDKFLDKKEGNWEKYEAVYTGNMSRKESQEYWRANGEENFAVNAIRMAKETGTIGTELLMFFALDSAPETDGITTNSIGAASISLDGKATASFIRLFFK